MVRLSSRLIRTHKPRRIGNSIRLMREEIARHSKTTPDKVKIGGELNRYLLLGAMQGFYGVKIEVEKTGENVKADLAEKRKVPATAHSKTEAKAEKKTEEKEAPKGVKERLTAKAPEEKAKEKKAEEQKKQHQAPKAGEKTQAAGQQGPEKD